MQKHFLSEDLLSRDETYREFTLIRGQCLAAYAFLENSLVSLFAHLMGTSRDFAGVSFFKMNNARARNATLERLLKKRHGSTHNIFWNSYGEQLRGLDAKRNNIVHWATRSEYISGPPISKVVLVPPNYEDGNENTPEIRLENLIEFIERCDFLARLTEMFLFILGSRLAFVNRDEANKILPTWIEIFQNPIAYPPPEAHPLCRKH